MQVKVFSNYSKERKLVANTQKIVLLLIRFFQKYPTKLHFKQKYIAEKNINKVLILPAKFTHISHLIKQNIK